MIKFLHTADIHLDSPLRGLERYEGAPVAHLRQATRRAFENLIELAVGDTVDFVLIAGDLFDGDWKDYNTGLYFVSQMTRLREAGIPVYLITGNHDAAGRITKTLRLPGNVTVLPTDQPATATLEPLGVAIHGQGFETPAVKKNLAAQYPAARPGYFNIGLLHTCATGREGHEPYAPCTLGELTAKGYDYWALGHVHKREVLHQTPLVVFPGNIQGRHIRETGAKGCLRVTVDDRGKITTTFRALDVIRWGKIHVEGADLADGYDGVDRISERIETLLDQNDGLPLALRIEVSGESAAHDELTADAERWTGEIRSMALDAFGDRVWIEKVKFSTTPPRLTGAGEPMDGPVGELLKYMDAVRSDPEQSAVLGKSLDDLMQKLPTELKHGPDAVNPQDAAWLDDVLNHVRSILLKRLLSTGMDR